MIKKTIAFFIQHATSLIVPIIRLIGSNVYKLFRLIMLFFSNPAAWFLAMSYPVVELFIMLFTKWRGFLSPYINIFIQFMWSKVTAYAGNNINLGSAFDGVLNDSIQLMCYLGVTKSLNVLINGLVTATVLYVVAKIAIYIIRLKISLVAGRFGIKI